MLLSVIVPVYNGETYLSECLVSLADQGMSEQDYEVLIVNDGSTDGTEAVIDSFCCSNPVFKKINKENGGVSSARNLGIAKAAGEYLTFVDADDAIAPLTYAVVMNYVLENQLDGFYFEKSGNRNRVCTVSDARLRESTVLCDSYGPCGSQGVIFKKSILDDKGILFNEGMTNNEDLLFSFYYTNSTSRVGRSKLPLYFYRQNDTSVTSTLFQNRGTYGNEKTREYRCYVSMLIFLSKLREYREAHPDNALCRYMISAIMQNLLWIGMRCCYKPSIVLADLKECGLLLCDIQLKKSKNAKEALKNYLRYVLRYPLIYRLVCFVYRVSHKK